ncbi:DUF6071 family protein [Streptomyces sp. NPDC048508]|uniref:DUF6071 family protein n=1 Tax=Streptomyces sp. NPDC048508 TaxID=3365561 RepID=UPI003719A646
MIDTIYANGCSFTAGSELEHENQELISPVDIDTFRRERSWPKCLGDRIGAVSVVNEARGGGSNVRAVRMTYDFVARYLSKGKDASRLLVLIGITDLVRNEFRTEQGAWELLKPNLAARSTKDRTVRKRNELYYRTFFDAEQAVRLHVQQYAGLAGFLDVQGICHHFHEAMPNNAPILREHTEAVSLLRLLDRHVWRGITHEDMAVHFDGRESFESWSIAAGIPLGPGGHPLTEGHYRWAEKLHENVRALLRRRQS